MCTDVVRLRQLEEEDLVQLRDWRNSEWLRPYVREYRLLNMVNQHDWLGRASRDSGIEMFGIEAVTKGGMGILCTRLVGACGLTHINWVNHTAEVSIYVAPRYQGRGIGKRVLELLRQKAFDEFNLYRLWAEIYAFNEASVGLFEAAGYELEGRLKSHVFKLGERHDSLLYGLLREDSGG